MVLFTPAISIGPGWSDHKHRHPRHIENTLRSSRSQAVFGRGLGPILFAVWMKDHLLNRRPPSEQKYRLFHAPTVSHYLFWFLLHHHLISGRQEAHICLLLVKTNTFKQKQYPCLLRTGVGKRHLITNGHSRRMWRCNLTRPPGIRPLKTHVNIRREVWLHLKVKQVTKYVDITWDFERMFRMNYMNVSGICMRHNMLAGENIYSQSAFMMLTAFGVTWKIKHEQIRTEVSLSPGFPHSA